MKTTVYIIRGKESLNSLPIDSDWTSAELDMGDIRNHPNDGWTKEEEEIKVKLLYLAQQRNDQELKTDEDWLRVFGTNEISVELFDKYWELEEWQSDLDSNEILEESDFKNINFRETGNPNIDQWVKKLR